MSDKRKKITAEDLKVGDKIRFFGSKMTWLVERAVTGYVGEFRSPIYMLHGQEPLPFIPCMRVKLKAIGGDGRTWTHSYTFNYRFWGILKG